MSWVLFLSMGGSGGGRSEHYYLIHITILCGIKKWMTGRSKILWCLKAVILGAIYITSNANTLWIFHFVASSALLFSAVLPSTKKYLFYSAFQRESGKKKKYCNWLLLSVSVEKTGIVIKTSNIFEQKNPNSCLLSVICQ